MRVPDGKPYRRISGTWAILVMCLLLSVVLLSLPGLALTADKENWIESPLPEKIREPGRPATWVFPGKDEYRQFGAMTVVIPAGFTKQGGANIIGNMLPNVEEIVLPAGFVPGTLFALGIWPANEQTVFEKPITLRLQIDAAQFHLNAANQLTFVQFDSESKRWFALGSVFQAQIFQLATDVQSFTPVAKSFPNWGGRTLFAVVRGGASGASIPSTMPTVQRNANLRIGPGTTFAKVGEVTPGQALTLDGRNEDGTWLRLEDGRWIAAFLVADAPDLPVVSVERNRP